MTPSTQKQTEAAKHAVQIDVNGKDLKYTRHDGRNAASIVVRQGDHISWSCKHGNYSILFKRESPFHEIAVHGRRGNDTVSAVVVGEEGSYHYAVTVSLDGELIVDDPEVIVDNAGD